MSKRIQRVVTPEEIEAARKVWMQFPLDRVGSKLAELMGLPTVKTTLKAEVRNRRIEDDGIVVEDIWFESEPGTLVPTFLCYPKNLRMPALAILCIHPTGGNRNHLVEKGYRHEAPMLYGWGRELARRGFVTFFPTCHSFGERRELGEKWEDNVLHMILWCRSAASWLVWDAIRCLDYLETRPEVDANRLGCMGFSLGGITTWMTMAVDKRIKVGVPIGGALGSWVGKPKGHTAYLYLPNVLRHFDQPQVVASIAPRALLVIHSLLDGYVSNESVVEMETYAKSFYEKLAANERFKVHMPPGEHDLTTEILDLSTDWFRRWL